MQDSITSLGNNPLGAANAGLDNVIGPSYDYLKNIQSPAAKGVSSAGTMDQVFTNTGAIAGYVNDLIAGPTGGFGNQFFSDTGGKCKAPDGTIVHRWSWVNNKMIATDAGAILGPSFQRAVEGNGIDGIVPGIGGDIAAINPLKIMNAMVLDGIPPCQAFTCPITDDAGANRDSQTRFLTPSLELNMRGCKIATAAEAQKALNADKARMKAVEAAAKRGEKFTPYFSDSYSPNVLVDTDPTPAIVLGVAVALFLGYVVTRIH